MVPENDMVEMPGRLDAWVLPPPTATIGVPSNNATVSGVQNLEVNASPGMTKVRESLEGCGRTPCAGTVPPRR
jgi:hypothetical protein